VGTKPSKITMENKEDDVLEYYGAQIRAGVRYVLKGRKANRHDLEMTREVLEYLLGGYGDMLDHDADASLLMWMYGGAVQHKDAVPEPLMRLLKLAFVKLTMKGVYEASRKGSTSDYLDHACNIFRQLSEKQLEATKNLFNRRDWKHFMSTQVLSFYCVNRKAVRDDAYYFFDDEFSHLFSSGWYLGIKTPLIWKDDKLVKRS
jgi:hypothetical protein